MAEMTKERLDVIRRVASMGGQNTPKCTLDLLATIDELAGGLETALSMLAAGAAQKDFVVSSWVQHWSATLCRLGMGVDASENRTGEKP